MSSLYTVYSLYRPSNKMRFDSRFDTLEFVKQFVNTHKDNNKEVGALRIENCEGEIFTGAAFLDL